MKKPIENRVYVLAIVAILALSSGSRIQAQITPSITIPIKVTEVSGYNRTNDPVTSGIPIPTSAVADSWSLTDGATEIPLQTTVLAGQATPWLLLDFPTSVNSTLTKNYTLRNIPPTTPATGLSYVHTNSTETVVTGPIKMIIGTSPFIGVQDLWYDTNGNAVFEAGEHRITSGRSDALRITNAETNVTTSATPTPTAIAWEDQGTQRGTLRIDGAFVEASTQLLAYTLRLTFWSGRSDVGVDVILKNSNAAATKHVKLSSAIFQIGTSATIARANRIGDPVWAQADASGQTIQALPIAEQVSTAYDPYAVPFIERQTTVFTVDTNGGLIIGDLSHLRNHTTIDFSPSLTAEEQTSLSNRVKTPAMARADASWYGAQHAFGLPNFGSFEDEQAAYTAWNWAATNPTNTHDSLPHISRPTNFYPSWSTVDGAQDPESDFISQNILMYVRLGDQGYLDRTEAFSRFAMSQWISRTDGFTNYGNDYWDGPHAVNRGTDTVTNATAYDLNRLQNDMPFGRADYSHVWVGGLVDYYYLTGNREALTAATDVAEECRNQSDWYTAGTSAGAVSDSPRSKARCWQNTLRVWEATGDAQWQTSATQYRNLFLLSTMYSKERMYHGNTCDLGAAYCTRYPNGQFISPFQVGDTVHAMFLDYTLFNQLTVKNRLIELADFALLYGVDPVTKATGDYTVFVGNTVYHHTYSQFRGGVPPYPYNFASSSLSYIDTLAVGYRLTGNLKYLGLGKTLLAEGTKRLGAQPYSERIAGSNEIGQYMGNLDGNANSFYNNDLTYTALFLKDAVLADDTPPSATTDLSAN